MAERRRKTTNTGTVNKAPTGAAAKATGALSVEDVMQRAALAGIEIEADQWETLTLSMNMALRSLTALQPREQRGLEPAVRFEP